MSDDTTPDPQASIARVRRLMVMTMIFTIFAVIAVFLVIGYRLFHLQGSAPAAAFTEITAKLPAGAKVLSTGVSNNRIVVTLQVDGGIELRTYDPATLKPLGRLRLVEPKP